jgi:hypothetical protein
MKKGWLDKYENGGEYLGTTNVGRNYSPAWGGQFQKGGELQKKRYEELYSPIENKVFDAVGTSDDYLKLPSSTRDFLDKTIAGFSVTSNRNIPPMDPVIKEVQDKVKNLSKEEINKLLKTNWSKIGMAGAIKNTPSSVSYLDMLKYINHFKKLKKQGYTFETGGNLMPPMAGANQTLPMYQMGGYFYPTTFVPQAEMGGSIPGSVGFTYARTQDIPSEGPYAKKTLPSAQKGKLITKREDFEPWWNWASKKAGDVDRRQDAYGKLGDLYAYYSGQPLKYDVLEYSAYKPTMSKNPNTNYIAINDPKFKQEIIDKYNEVFVNKLADKQTFPTEREKGRMKSTKINDNTYAVSGYSSLTPEEYQKVKKLGQDHLKIKGQKHVSNAIGRYFLSKGKDEKGDYISYYDTFDEGSGPDGGGIGETLGLTKPFEIYDRIYLDPKTGKPKLQHGGEMSFYQHGLDWTPRNISKNGSVVKDNMGYWNPDNWGRIVEIDSPNITMKGVNQGLIGISDEGDVQYMEPGKDYKFKGKKVKEYPVAKYGVNQQDEKTAQHLDQLLNFTNYNKPTKGGWLDKY